MKPCTRCDVAQPLDNFDHASRSRDGRTPHCKSCQKERNVKYRTLGPAPKRTVVDRFWAKVNRAGPVHSVLGTACWEWTAASNGVGYGVLGARPRYAHRFSWEAHAGPIPSGLFVCHRCDNRKCVRPDHLFLGDARDNHADMIAKGRHRSGGKRKSPRSACVAAP